MALDLQAACGMVVRPDIRPKTIMIQCGIHTGPVVAGKIMILRYFSICKNSFINVL